MRHWTLKEKLSAIYPYSNTYKANIDNFQWIILHKGMLQGLDSCFLTHVTNTLIPVFVNEVFVVFSQHRDLPPVKAHSPHLRALWAAMKREAGFWFKLGRIVKQLKLALQFSRLPSAQPNTRMRSDLPLSGASPAPAGPRGKQSLSEPVPDYATLSVAEIRDLMNQRYEAKAAYHITVLWDQVRAEELTQRILKMISPTVGKRIFEIGCGIGGSASYISAQDCDEYIGTDLSETAINHSRQVFSEKPNFRFMAMDATHIEFEDNSFDIVIAREMIEHLPDPLACITEVFRSLKPGGQFVLTSPNRDSLHLRVNRMLGYQDFKCSFDHIKEFTFQEASDMLREVGFDIEETGGVFLQPYWGIPGIDQHIRHMTDNDATMVELTRQLGERVGAEYGFCFVISARKPSTL